LAEYYSLSRDERVAPLLKKAVGLHRPRDSESDDGGWSFFFKNDGATSSGPSETDVTGWQIQALYAAHLTGLNIDGVDASLDKAMLDLKRVQVSREGSGTRVEEIPTSIRALVYSALIYGDTKRTRWCGTASSS